MEKNIKIIELNKKAYHNYYIIEEYEAGLSLTGTEVKSIRQNGVSLKESFVRIDSAYEMQVYGMHIAPYDKGNIFNKDPLRVRKLLMHKKEIVRLKEKLEQKGFTIVPVNCHFKNGRVKLQIALAKGKALYDKRAVEAKRSAEMEISRAIKTANQRK